MAKQNKTTDPKAAAYFKGLGISPEASVTVRTEQKGPKQKSAPMKVYTLLQICEGYAEAMEPPKEAEA